MSRRRRILGVGGITAVAVAGVWSHEGHHAIPTKGITIDEQGLLHLEPMARKAVGLAVEAVDFGTIEEVVPLIARVIVPWDKKGIAGPRVEGVVREVLARPGRYVEFGEPLAFVESLTLEAMRRDLRQAEIELKLAEENLSRSRELTGTVLPGREILALEAERDERKNTIASLRQKQVVLAAPDGFTMTVFSPLSGTVVRAAAAVGQHAGPEDVLFEIQDLREVRAECEVPENLLRRISTGQDARLTFIALPGRVLTGTIEQTEFSFDPVANVRRVWVRLPNADGALLPGLFGTAEVVVNRVQDATAAPAGAIVTDGAERYVFVQEREGAYRKKNVVLGATDGRRVEVREGLYPGDNVVTSGTHELASLYVQGTFVLSDEARKNIGLAVEEIDSRPVDRVIRVNARVVSPPGRRGLATARVEGKVERIWVVPGQDVKAGAPLADLVSLELMNAQLDLIQAHLRRRLAEKQAESLKTLAEKGYSTRKEQARVDSEVQALAGRFESLRRSLLLMGLSGAEVDNFLEKGEILRTATVRAPVNGRVTDIRVVPGQVVRPEESLFEVVDPDKVWVEGIFFETDLDVLLRGPADKPAVVRAVARADREWNGKVAFVNRAIGDGGNTLRGWVEIDNEDGGLVPGMHAALVVTAERPEEKVIAAPLRALLSVGRKHFAFVDEGKRFRRVEVEIGRRDARYAEVVRGLFPGDRVVVSGVNEMNNALSAVR